MVYYDDEYVDFDKLFGQWMAARIDCHIICGLTTFGLCC